jgi:oligopeptide/dipeptide ABC transporter ATP-binding protein
MFEEPNVSLLSVNGLTKHFPIKGSRQVVSAVNDVSFTVNAGETLGLVGESGSGKTTVGRCLLRLVEPNAGTIVFDGKTLSGIPLRQFRPYRARLQLVFQDPYHSLDPRRRLGDSIAEPMQLLPGLTRAQKRARVRELVQRVRLNPEIADAYPHQLSAGQQQRVGIARAMASEPQLIVLDEPTSSLDITVRAEIVDLLGQLQRDLGLSYLFISHDLSTVEHLCHRVAVMYLSRIVETGTTNQIFHHPRHPYTKALLSSVLPPDPKREVAVIELRGEIPSPINLPTGCYLSSRCPAAQAACHSTRPELLDIGYGHRVACLRVQNGTLPEEWTPETELPVAVTRAMAS